MGRINTLVSRAILGRADSAPGVQTLQIEVLADEHMDGVEHLEPYGFTSVPLAGAEGVVLNVGGQRGACVGINFGNRGVRVKGLKGGEVCIYTDEGDTITLKRGNLVEIKTKHLVADAEDDATITTKEATIEASATLTLSAPQIIWKTNGVSFSGYSGGTVPTLTMTGNIDQTGSITSTGDHVSGGVSLQTHRHTGDSGGTTGAPL
jgi:phage baseplate assembly protein V